MYEIEDGEKKEREKLGELDEGLGGLAGDYDRDGDGDERERGHVYGKTDELETSEMDRPSGSRAQTQTGDEMV